MNVLINKSKLYGEINIPPSKSVSHRAIICACLSYDTSTIRNISYSEDIIATIDVMKNLGADIVKYDSYLKVKGNKINLKGNNLYFNESGSTLRFIIPIALTTGSNIVFNGNDSLKKRPLYPYYDIFKKSNISYYNDAKSSLPLCTSGKLTCGNYTITGKVSSQFITGLLYGLSLVEGKSTIIISDELESKGYVDITIDVLKKFGVDIINENHKKYTVTKSTYSAVDYTVEGDYSQLAFYLLAGAIGENVIVTGLDNNSYQGDKKILDIARMINIETEIEKDRVIIKSSIPKGSEIDIKDMPDFGPALFCIGAVCEGEMKITGIERLRIKESDRVTCMIQELSKLGVNIKDNTDHVIIKGKKNLLSGASLNTHNDHRIAMSLMMLSSIVGNTQINNIECIKKSYPGFLKDYEQINGNYKIVNK